MADEIAQRDQNRAIAVQGVSSVTGTDTVTVRVNPTTKRLLTDSSDTTVSSANASTKVSVGNTSTTVLSANTSRLLAILVNDSNEDIYVNLSGTAVMNEGIRVNLGGGSLEVGSYTGAITAICASGSKNMTVTEL